MYIDEGVSLVNIQVEDYLFSHECKAEEQVHVLNNSCNHFLLCNTNRLIAAL